MMWVVNWLLMTLCVYAGMFLERYLVRRRSAKPPHPFVNPKEPTLGD